jgi:hypothetical protein
MECSLSPFFLLIPRQFEGDSLCLAAHVRDTPHVHTEYATVSFLGLKYTLIL